jgi:hypothetical protein
MKSEAKIFSGTMPSQLCDRKRNVCAAVAVSFAFAAKREDAWSEKDSEHE